MRPIHFEPTSITTRTDSLNRQPVWIVTFRGSPVAGGPIEFEEVGVNRNTGEIVWAAIG